MNRSRAAVAATSGGLMGADQAPEHRERASRSRFSRAIRVSIRVIGRIVRFSDVRRLEHLDLSHLSTAGCHERSTRPVSPPLRERRPSRIRS